MQAALLQSLGDELYKAWRTGSVVDPLTRRHPAITMAEAYQVQQRLLDRRRANGESVTGRKIGAAAPVFGHLLDTMLIADGASVSMHSLIQPRAAGEIAFVLKRDLNGPGLGSADVLAATDCVRPCLAIADSRVRDWQVGIQDSIADNASCGVFALGEPAPDARRIDLRNCALVLERNGETVVTRSGATALGSPAHAVAWLANMLGPLGVPLKAGEVILSGAFDGDVPVAAGDSLRARIGGLGHCSIRLR